MGGRHGLEVELLQNPLESFNECVATCQSSTPVFISKTFGYCGAGREFLTADRIPETSVGLCLCDVRWGAEVLGCWIKVTYILCRAGGVFYTTTWTTLILPKGILLGCRE